MERVLALFDTAKYGISKSICPRDTGIRSTNLFTIVSEDFSRCVNLRQLFRDSAGPKTSDSQ